MSKGKILPGVFATQDENMHRMLKKPIASTYSMTNLVSFESFVDSSQYVLSIIRNNKSKLLCSPHTALVDREVPLDQAQADQVGFARQHRSLEGGQLVWVVGGNDLP